MFVIVRLLVVWFCGECEFACIYKGLRQPSLYVCSEAGRLMAVVIPLNDEDRPFYVRSAK